MQKILKAFLFVCLFLNLACNRTTKEITSTEQAETKPATAKPKPVVKTPVNESFEPFYIKFHKDSVFQMSRIKFPLQGYAIDTSEMPITWTKNNWVMHHSTIQQVDTSRYKVESELHNTYYKEKIYIEGGGFSAERIFKKLNGKWYLVSFIDEDL
jgi:hypothetical protein